jgi:hypothetical protein
MSEVLYVVHALPVDATRWRSIGELLRRDGYELHPRELPAEHARGFQTQPPPGVLVSFGERDSHEELVLSRWGPAGRRLLESRPRLVSLQAPPRSDDPLRAFCRSLSERVGEVLDGVLYVEIVDQLVAPDGKAVAREDEEAAAPALEETAPISLDSVQGLGTCVLECRCAFTPAELGDLAVPLELELRECDNCGCAQPGFEKARSALNWEAFVLWEPVHTGLTLTVQRVARGGPPFYVRAEMTINPDAFEETAEALASSAAIVRKLLTISSERLGVRLIDFET